jgi:hypothetical protein
MSARTAGGSIHLKFPFLLKNALTAAGALVGAALFTAMLASLQGWLPFFESSGSERSMVFIQVIVGLASLASLYAFLSKAFGRFHYIADSETLTVVLRILGVTLRRKSIRWSAITAIRTFHRASRRTRVGRTTFHVLAIETAESTFDRYSTRFPSVTRAYSVVRDGLVSVARFYGYKPDAE